MLLAQRVRRISESPTLAIDARASELKRQGVDIIGFGAGEPDFDTPEFIKAAAKQALDRGFTKYTPVAGIPELRRAISDKLKRDNGLDYDPSCVLVSCGAKHSIFNILFALVGPGDEVLIPAPYWVSYPEQVKLAGGTPVFLPCPMDRGFKLDVGELESAVTPRTRVLILNSPCNPTGAVYTRSELEAIAAVVFPRGVMVISDEVYELFSYGSRVVSIASLGEEARRLTVVVNAVSKTHSMTGWRIGYAAGPREVIKAASDIQSHVTSNPTSISQAAAVEALMRGREAAMAMAEEFRRRRDYIVARLNKMRCVECPTPEGAFYVFPRVSGLFGKKIGGRVIDASDTLAEVLLDKARIAVVPGSGFGAPDHIRMSFTASAARLAEGLDRMQAVLSGATDA